jgi:hypothetical protein
VQDPLSTPGSARPRVRRLGMDKERMALLRAIADAARGMLIHWDIEDENVDDLRAAVERLDRAEK